MPRRHRQSGSTLIWLTIWLVGMAAIAYWCVTRHVPALEQKIFNNAQAVLSSANAGEIDLSVEGRTATLFGSVTNEVQKNQLLSVVAEADGVSDVIDQLSIAGQPAITTAEDSQETGDTDKSTVAVEATSPNEDVTPGEPVVQADNLSEPSTPLEVSSEPLATAGSDEPMAEAENTEVAAEQTEAPSGTEVLDADVMLVNESDELPRVLETASPNGESATESGIEVAELIVNPEVPALQEPEITESQQSAEQETVETPTEDLAEPSAEESAAEPSTAPDTDSVEARALALIEQARKETAKSLIDPQTPRPDNSAALEQELTTVTEAQRTVAITEQPKLTMKVEQGTLTLTGDISDQDNLLTLIRSAMSTFDANYVVNSVQVHDYTAKADWLPALNQFLPNMKSISNAGVDIIESQITLSGEAPNDKQHDDVIDTALVELSELSLVERISIKEEARDSATETNNLADTTEQTEVDSGEPAQTDTTSESTESTPLQDAEAQSRALKGTFESLDTGKILFESGSDVLTEESRAVIETMAALFAEHPSVKIEIDGHTDASGDSSENLKLSQLRANAVRDFLVQKGIAADRLSAYGFGDGVPIADNSTPAGRRLNRRIEFNF